jgi:hypothetical protein
MFESQREILSKENYTIQPGPPTRLFLFRRTQMGDLIMMPVRHAASETVTESDATPKTLAPVVELKSEEKSSVDLAVWKTAPRERTAAYFPTYSVVSKAMQTAMRGWVREWFNSNPDVLLRPKSAYPILVYICTHPFSGRPTNMFTYDIQQTEALDRAFASAAVRLGRELKELDTQDLAWFKREHYFAYRSKEVLKYVIKNRRQLYKMLNVETVLVDSILKFALIDIPALGLDAATVILRRAFYTQLRRFSEEIDMTPHADELLRIATDALKGKLSNDNVVAMPLAA